MTSREKKGVGFGVTGLAFVVAAIVCFATEATPDWLSTVFGVVGSVAEMLGFKAVLPE